MTSVIMMLSDRLCMDFQKLHLERVEHEEVKALSESMMIRLGVSHQRKLKVNQPGDIKLE